ncbi:hypothetical protein LTR56_004821 [Elasticomyces elasticus]|nr:hypothetical protein LTR56_004821 [Elasticomyces elasticus]KAK3664595.1 hypothetical protein LTR22_004463 [Elasticomyces elasticus]KAK4918438.1 hypothetical protein LTR49_013830 [Elasticomyces elasticus]KAK5760305.1 hypothetical protein LTS12_009519 [Elasticomyces elasticus]
MDFQFDNRTGPIDAQSAFARVGQTPLLTTKKRSYSTYDSPSPTKSTTYTSPNKPLPPRPVFNALFSTPRKANDNWGDDSSAGETPRSPELPVADSPAETPDYMQQRTEVRRLEFPVAGMGLLPHEREPAKTGRRESWFSTQIVKAKGKWGGGFSPGRGQGAGEMVGMEKRGVEKRKKKDPVSRRKGGGTRQQQEQRRRERRDEDSYEDSEAEGDEDHDEERTASNNNGRRVGSPRTSSRNTHQQTNTTQPPPTPPEIKQHWMKQLYTFLESHPTIPHILTFYAQLFFNVFLLSLFAYTIYTIYRTFAHDIHLASQRASADILAEMAKCAREWTVNKCAPETRVPLLEELCEGLGKCMSRDAGAVGRAGVGAKTFAEVFNSFVEAISWKTMAFTFLLVFGVFGGGNFAFGLFRRSDTVNAWGGGGHGGGQHGGHGGQGSGQGSGQAMGGWNGQPHPQQGGWQGGYAPPTPQRTFSGEQQFYGGGTPWLRAMGGEGMEPQASQGAAIEGREGREVRRIGY